MSTLFLRKKVLLSVLCIAALLFTTVTFVVMRQPAHAQIATTATLAFQQVEKDYGVPADLLKSLCYMESRLNMHGGTPSIDGSYGCNLTKNKRINTLNQAAQKLGVSTAQLQRDLNTNIVGAGYILSEDARQVSPSHALPTTLQDWSGALAIYSNARSKATARLYTNEVYRLLKTGFSAPTEKGEVITVKPQTIAAAQTLEPNAVVKTMKARQANEPAAVGTLPAGCSDDGKAEYSGALNCILDPALHDCDLVPGTDCNYFSSDHYGPGYRQTDNTITHVVIHDIEGTALSALNFFEDTTTNVASHYIVDTDGTIYQVTREKDVAFQAGNIWFNQHSIGIEHAGYDATGFLWYNATQYLASAKLTAYLSKKYNIPVDHAHIVSHGTVPASSLANTPNHFDPGPYWLWNYYLKLIKKEAKQTGDTEQVGRNGSQKSQVFTLRPKTDLRPFGKNGSETAANFNFFYLYNGPSTASGLIPQASSGSDVTDVTNNVEPAISYYYTQKVKDPAGTGYTLYQIWYGEVDPQSTSKLTHAKQAWLAVPPESVVKGQGTVVTLKSADGSPIPVSGKPVTNTATSDFHTGDAPSGSTFVSSYKVVEDGGSTVWYSINYNHRQIWVPESAVVVSQPAP